MLVLHDARLRDVVTVVAQSAFTLTLQWVKQRWQQQQQQ